MPGVLPLFFVAGMPSSTALCQYGRHSRALHVLTTSPKTASAGHVPGPLRCQMPYFYCKERIIYVLNHHQLTIAAVPTRRSIQDTTCAALLPPQPVRHLQVPQAQAQLPFVHSPCHDKQTKMIQLLANMSACAARPARANLPGLEARVRGRPLSPQAFPTQACALE